MGTEKLPGRPFIALTVFLVYAVLYFFAMPDFVIARNDDFGYLASVTESLRLGRLHTSEWLEPHNAFLTFCSCLVYKATSSFYLATLGLLAFFSLANFWLLYLLVKKYVANPAIAAITALLFCTVPFYLAKSLDYVNAVPTLTLVLLAILAWEKQRTALFYLLVFIAFSSRQNGIALLVLPAYAFIRHLAVFKKIKADLVVYTLLLAIAIIGLRKFMNVTYAQLHITNQVLASFNGLKSLTALATGLLMIIFFTTSLQVFLFSPLAALKNNIRKPWLPLLFTGLLAFVYLNGKGRLILFETTPFDKDALNPAYFLVLLAATWSNHYEKTLRINPYQLLSLAYVALVSIRGVWWDYYLIEVAIACLVWQLTSVSPEKVLLTKVSHLLAYLLIFVQVGFWYYEKKQIDKAELRITVYEQALRKNLVTADELSEAPFGYLGWKLYDYYITHEGKTFSGLSRFIQYVDFEATDLELKGSISGDLSVAALDSGTYRVGWVNIPYRLVRKKEFPEPVFKLNKAKFEPRIFPLDDPAWKQYIEGK